MKLIWKNLCFMKMFSARNRLNWHMVTQTFLLKTSIASYKLKLKFGK